MSQFQTVIESFALESPNPSAVGDIFVAKTERTLLGKLGTVIGFAELFGAPERFQERFLEIVGDIKTEYYLPPFDTTTGVERRFEDCLQRANRRIGRALQESVEKVDVDNINVLVVLLHNSNIYISYIGTVNAFLFHQKKQNNHAIVDIISQAGDKRRKINPDKLFSSIISGSITNRDNLLFCNESVLEYVSQTELLATVCEKSAPTAAHYLQTVLAGGQTANNFYGIIVQPLQREAELAGDPRNAERIKTPARVEPQRSINQLVHTQSLTEAHLNPSRLPNWRLFISYVFKLATGVIEQVITIIVNLFKSSTRAIHNYYRKTKFRLAKDKSAKQPITPLTPLNNSELIEEIESPITVEQLTAPVDNPVSTPRSNPWTNRRPVTTIAISQTETVTAVDYSHYDSIETMPEPAVNNGRPILKQILTRTKTTQIRQIFNPVLTTLPNVSWLNPLGLISNGLNRLLAWIFSLPRPQQIILAIIFILLIAFSQSVVWQGQALTGNGGLAKDQLIIDIERQLILAESQNVFNDEAGARASIAKAQELLAELPDRRQYQTKRSELEAKIAQLQQSLEKITRLDNPTVIYSAEAGTGLTGLVKIGSDLVTIDQSGKTIYRIKTDGQTTRADSDQELTDIISIDNIGATAALITTRSAIYRYDTASNTTRPVLTGQALTALAVYGDRVYSLQAERGQVYRHTFVGENLNSGAAWIKDGTDVKAATAIAIDGNIVVGRRDGSITYLANGANQNITFGQINPGLNIDDIQTAENAKYVYALDRTNKRIAVYDKTGPIKTQFQSPRWDKLQAMAVVENEKKIYLLADNIIYQLEINF